MVIRVFLGEWRLGVFVTPSSPLLLLIVAAFFTPTLGLWAAPSGVAEFAVGFGFLIAALAVAAYLLPRAALILTGSGVTPVLRRTLPWDEVADLIVSQNGSSLLDSWVVVAVRKGPSYVLYAAAGYSRRAVERRRAAIGAWRPQSPDSSR